MIYADKISFKKYTERTLKTIYRIHLFSTADEKWKIDASLVEGWYEKETINRWLRNNLKTDFTIRVYKFPYPILEPVEKSYVRTKGNYTNADNLLELRYIYE